MRDAGRIRAVWAAVVALAVLAGVAGLGIAQGGDQVQPATLIRTRGDVSILPPGAAAWRRANERERFEQGTRIRTGDDAEAIIELSDRNLVRIGPRTEIALDVALVRREVDPNESVMFFPARRDVHQFSVNLPQGNAASVLKGLRGDSRYDLHTPVATAGVRGTVFVADVQRSGRGAGPGGERGQGTGGVTANFVCLEGSLNITGPSFPTPFVLPPGYSLTVAGFEAAAGGPPPGGPAPATPAQVQTAVSAVAPAQAIIQRTENAASVRTIDLQVGGADEPADAFEGKNESGYSAQ